MTHFIETRDGVRIALHRVGPESGPAAILVPGTFSNHTFWLGTRGTGFARALAAAGFDCWVLDPRGHGASQRPRRGQTWDFDDWARHDIPAAIGAVAANGRAPFLVGHSAGGSAALAALAAQPELRAHVSGAVVAGTPAPWLQPWRWLVARGTGWLARLLGHFPARALRLGPEDELTGVMVQWMGWNLSGRWTGRDGSDYSERLGALDLPLLALAGAGDRVWAPPAACRALFELVGSRDGSYLLCGRETGFSIDFNHVSLLVSREAQAEVWPHIIDWLAARANLPAGVAAVRQLRET